MIQRPKGCNDIYGKEGLTYLYVRDLFRSIAELYNYEFVTTPTFESSDLFHRTVGETSDIVSKETYDFLDRGNRKLTLKPEATAGVCRLFVEDKLYGSRTMPVKFYYQDKMFRYERPQSGRDREFIQFGVEALGSSSPTMDVEVISLAVNYFGLIGLPGIKVLINTLGDLESRKNYQEAIKSYFKKYLDEMCDDCKARFYKNPLRILDCKIDSKKDFFKEVPKIEDYLTESSKERFQKVLSILDNLDIKYELDDSLVRGLDYYDHTVFEIEADLKGNNVICGGGRYNRLIEELDGPATPGVGFAIGVSRLMNAILEAKIQLPIDERISAYIIALSEKEKEYGLLLANFLRMNGFKVELEHTDRSMKAAFREADRKEAHFTIILNEENIKDNLINIKHNKTKEEEVVKSEVLIYYMDQKLEEEEELYE